MRSFRAGYRLLALLLLLTLGFAPADQATLAQTPPIGSLVDANGDVGETSDLVIGQDGLGLIAYYDTTNQDLKVAHCKNLQCSQSSRAIIDSQYNVGKYGSIVIGNDGLGVIAYMDLTNRTLKIAHCQNVECSSATISTITSTLWVTFKTDIVIGANGFPAILYAEDDAIATLKYVQCHNITCSVSTITTLDEEVYGSFAGKMIVGGDNKVIIAYNKLIHHLSVELKFKYCNNEACSDVTTTQIYINPADIFSYILDITINSNNYPIISFYDIVQDHLLVAQCNTFNCSDYTINLVDSIGAESGTMSSIMIGFDGLPLIVYHIRPIAGVHDNDDLRIAHCENIACSSATITTITAHLGTFLGYHPTIKKGADNLGLFIYFDLINTNLRVVHCANILCTKEGQADFAQYLALVQAPITTFSLLINQQTIPVQPVAQQGQVFYQTTINVPSIVPTGGSFVLSADPDGQTPSLVDDAVVFKLNNQEVFRFEYTGSIAPSPTLVTIPNSLVAQWAGQTLTVEFHDRFAGQIQASTMYLVWLP
ncbi:MAG TPA: hypothetical protein DEF47_24860 [Herpetosiphon sp.]|uniref:Uncharacterized protein n=1 Tax=Herpetosiphon aurantiacus (strain ATCC 23779 / DSM 785 / 114-95) TaxID=316274 RepID=A9B0Y3_HERA2|nr:hypothetical protein [Herpetosiphon sp.]ABX03853.1 hypothetical protein Haur_1205 [Herpetosiphon aurantiacus DSM 785]HBW53127.1 hypothetical protein [Herpetosiphon sp.]